jgi:TPP-dependent pyruvate/acetoin dehydrogenase alpha subunit
MDIGRDVQLKLLEKMILIRVVEEAIAAHYSGAEMRCPTHLSIGQEGPAAAAGLSLRSSDFVVSTHRGHAHYLACGGDVKAMIAELYGKEAGCARGRGGSMHLVDCKVGFMGTTAIVGNSIPIGLGLAKSIQLNGSDAVACVFIGDAAVETGVFFESANFAATAKLPVLFVCENNGYSVYTSMRPRQPEGRRISKLAESIGLTSSCGDGNDAEISFRLISEAVNSIRQGRGPQFVELETYRWREHCGPNYDDNLGYRPKSEVERWLARDPIRLLSNRMSSDAASVEHLEQYRQRITLYVSEAFEEARAAPFPRAEEAYLDEYARF